MWYKALLNPPKTFYLLLSNINLYLKEITIFLSISTDLIQNYQVNLFTILQKVLMSLLAVCQIFHFYFIWNQNFPFQTQSHN